VGKTRLNPQFSNPNSKIGHLDGCHGAILLYWKSAASAFPWSNAAPLLAAYSRDAGAASDCLLATDICNGKKRENMNFSAHSLVRL